MITDFCPVVSVITVNYRSEIALQRCLASLHSDPLPIEVIVVDNGSVEDKKNEILSCFPAVTWIEMGRNAGFGRACNAGVTQAHAEKLLFLNPDARVMPQALSNLKSVLDQPEFGDAVIGCAIHNDDGSVQLSCRRFPTWSAAIANRYSLITKLLPRNQFSRAYLMTDFDHGRACRVDWVSGAAMAMNRRVFVRLRGFDDRYFLYCEDVDICKRAMALGIQTWYYPGANVMHSIGGSSRRAMGRALVQRHYSIWKYYERHHRSRWLDVPVALFLAGRLVMSLTMLGLYRMKSRRIPHNTFEKRPARIDS